MGERLQLTSTINTERNFSPPLTIQPLVENAIQQATLTLETDQLCENARQILLSNYSSTDKIRYERFPLPLTHERQGCFLFSYFITISGPNNTTKPTAVKITAKLPSRTGSHIATPSYLCTNASFGFAGL